MTHAITLARTSLLCLCLLALFETPAAAQAGPLATQLMQDGAVRAALDRIRRDEPQVLEDQVRLCEIPAPPFQEQARAAAVKLAFEGLGLRNVRIDAAGNVLGELTGAAPSPHLVIAAHLDTVFPEGTDVRTTRSGTEIKGPGIADDCRGLAVLLALARQLKASGLQVAGRLTLVANVGEEGLGDLRGMKHLFGQELKGTIDRFVSIDGAGYGITHIAVGSLRYRVSFKGPGGHSYGAFGIANPVHALGRAIARIADLRVPSQPKTTFNVGRVGGGTSVNSIAFESWMEVDMRSADQAALAALDAGFHKAVDLALVEENERWGNRGRLSVDKALVGIRPGGRLPADAPIVQTAVSVSRALQLTPALSEGSTDANIPISMGIPGITIGGGGTSAGSHSPAELFDSTNSWQGTARAFLLALALTR